MVVSLEIAFFEAKLEIFATDLADFLATKRHESAQNILQPRITQITRKKIGYEETQI